MRNSFLTLCHYLIGFFCFDSYITKAFAVQDKPNIIVILTDQHNIRTIGRYREYLTKKHSTKQAFVWGENATVETKHIDSLADTGAIFTNFHTVSPICTTSRGALMTGLYPAANGANGNHVPLNEDAKTFATFLQDEFDYNTAYLGKWHLNGKSKKPTSFGAPQNRSFGFNHTDFLWNRGHWKFIDHRNDTLKGLNYKKGRSMFRDDELRDYYTTDFLTNETINFIHSQNLQNKTFAMVVSYPDPHAPHLVRPPYDTMFNDVNFSFPFTGKAAIQKSPAIPDWSYRDPKYRSIPLDRAEAKIQRIERSKKFKKRMSKGFGMIKLIDDSVGRILEVLEETGLRESTIVVFTSDHGDMMTEHANDDKVLPYQASAAVPFIISWPGSIKPKVIETPYSSIDFAPSIIRLAGLHDVQSLGFDGIDASAGLLDGEPLKPDETQTRFMDGPNGRYAAAFDGRFKLILSKKGSPWLFDSHVDPDELINYYKKDSFYEGVSEKMQLELFKTMLAHNFGILNQKIPVLLDKPVCEDTLDDLGDVLPFHTCDDLVTREQSIFESNDYCRSEEINQRCPWSCKSCIQDSPGRFAILRTSINCKKVAEFPNRFCKYKYVKSFCADSCTKFFDQKSDAL